MPGGPGRVENLKPAKPGEVRNPTGRNQYTKYREAFDAALAELSQVEGEETPRTRFQAILDAAMKRAEQGDTGPVQMILERCVPKVERHEHEFPEADFAGLSDAVAGIAARAGKANGSGKPHAPTANGSDGVGE